MPERPRVVVTRHLPDEVEERIRTLFDATLREEGSAMTAQELAGALREADGLLITVADRLDAGVLQAGPIRAGILASFGVGYDHVDVAAAAAAGIVVTNTPGVLTDDTADLTIALMLMSARRLGQGERQLRAGAWEGWHPTHLLGTRVSGATLGIVGMGRIGRAVAARARHGFGMRILYHQPRRLDAAALDGIDATWCPSLDELLGASDIVSLHVPATPATRRLIDADRLAAMRPGAFLINTARGDIVDEAALIAALREGRIRGAGLDVYADEPRVPPELCELENAVLLPHMGSATVATRRAMGHRAVDNLQAFFDGREPPDRVR